MGVLLGKLRMAHARGDRLKTDGSQKKSACESLQYFSIERD